MNKLLESVKLLGLNMIAGTEKNGLVCPKCKGGRGRDKAFSIAATHSHFKFICFRATCGFKGTIDRRSGTLTEGPKINKPTLNPYTYPTTRLEGDFFKNKFKLNATLKWNAYTGRVLFPIRDISLAPLGYVARGYAELGWNGNGPKTLNYISDDSNPFIHFPSTPLDSVVVVEDWVSAEKLKVYHDSVAILGTHMSPEVATYLAKHGIRVLYLAFDSNAWNKYSGIESKYGLMFKRIEGLRWESGLDPKDMSEEELAEVFGDLK